MGKSSAAGVDNTARRVWDKEEYAEKADKREKEVRTRVDNHRSSQPLGPASRASGRSRMQTACLAATRF
jgi:hypothetical protein